MKGNSTPQALKAFTCTTGREQKCSLENIHLVPPSPPQSRPASSAQSGVAMEDKTGEKHTLICSRMTDGLTAINPRNEQ